LLTEDDRADGSSVCVGGLVTSVQRKMTKKGDTWAIVTLEDLEGGVDVMLFPSTYALAAPLLVQDAVIVVKAGCAVATKAFPRSPPPRLRCPTSTQPSPDRW
jgi:DNA polymerase III alpha subunit